MGFGLSYSLPVVVAGLVAPQRDALLIVENPEAHLHPAGQSRMGTFLATVAATGVQVLGGDAQRPRAQRHPAGDWRARRAAARRRAGALLRREGGRRAAEHRAALLGSGGLNEWPKRFFDGTGGRRRAGEGAPRGGEQRMRFVLEESSWAWDGQDRDGFIERLEQLLDRTDVARER